MLNPSYDRQAVTLRFYTVLMSLTQDWAGSLILSCGVGAGGLEFALASNIAGATSISIDADAASCRAAMRLGAVDFVVNSVDEALRVVKNESPEGNAALGGAESG